MLEDPSSIYDEVNETCRDVVKRRYSKIQRIERGKTLKEGLRMAIDTISEHQETQRYSEGITNDFPVDELDRIDMDRIIFILASVSGVNQALAVSHTDVTWLPEYFEQAVYYIPYCFKVVNEHGKLFKYVAPVWAQVLVVDLLVTQDNLRTICYKHEVFSSELRAKLVKKQPNVMDSIRAAFSEIWRVFDALQTPLFYITPEDLRFLEGIIDRVSLCTNLSSSGLFSKFYKPQFRGRALKLCDYGCNSVASFFYHCGHNFDRHCLNGIYQNCLICGGKLQSVVYPRQLKFVNGQLEAETASSPQCGSCKQVDPNKFQFECQNCHSTLCYKCWNSDAPQPCKECEQFECKGCRQQRSARNFVLIEACDHCFVCYWCWADSIRTNRICTFCKRTVEETYITSFTQQYTFECQSCSSQFLHSALPTVCTSKCCMCAQCVEHSHNLRQCLVCSIEFTKYHN